MGKVVAVSVFFAMIGAMTIGGLWSAFRLGGTDAVLAASFGVVLVVTFVVQLVRGRKT